MINDKTNLKDQIAQLERKIEAAYQTILAIARDRHFRNTQMKTIWKLVTTCLIPIITYGGETTRNLPKQRRKNKPDARQHHKKNPNGTHINPKGKHYI